MHRLPLTIDERAALVARHVADVRKLGATVDLASCVVAERHHIPLATVTRLRRRHQRTERRHRLDPAAT